LTDEGDSKGEVLASMQIMKKAHAHTFVGNPFSIVPVYNVSAAACSAAACSAAACSDGVLVVLMFL
jgi:hypothetical protein